jgi:ketosteroid isomerase-like protein
MTMSATLDRAAAGGDLEAGDGDPSQRKRVDADVVDVITLRDGLVASKDTYVDALEMQRQLGS